MNMEQINHFSKYFPSITKVNKLNMYKDTWRDYVDRLGNLQLYVGDVKLYSNANEHVCVVGVTEFFKGTRQLYRNAVFLKADNGINLELGPENAMEALDTICTTLRTEDISLDEFDDKAFGQFCRWTATLINPLSSLNAPGRIERLRMVP